MITLGERFANEATQLIGAPFKLGGRSPELGLDCVGLAACSLEAIGIKAQTPAGYRLRNASVSKYLELAELHGLGLADGLERRGDLVLVRPGPAQCHLAIADGHQLYIHAHAGLRKTVRTSLPDEWPVLRRWRLTN